MFDFFRPKPTVPTIELVNLTERRVASFFVDDNHYKLTVRVDGVTTVIKRCFVGELLTLTDYNEMLRQALPKSINQMVKDGYKVITNDKFILSPVRMRILKSVTTKRPSKK